MLGNAILISKLFGQYSCRIDFDSRRSILIGENGAGKSTILRILRCLASFDFLSLAEYRFESISICRGDNKSIIAHSDLFPSIKDVAHAVLSTNDQYDSDSVDDLIDNYLREDPTLYDLNDDLELKFGIDVIWHLAIINRIDNGYYFNDYISSCFFNHPINGDIHKYTMLESENVFDITDISPVIKEAMRTFTSRTFDHHEITKSERTPKLNAFRNAKIIQRSDIVDGIKAVIPNGVLLLDMVNRYSFSEGRKAESGVHSNLLKWFTSYKDMGKYDNWMNTPQRDVLIGVPQCRKSSSPIMVELANHIYRNHDIWQAIKPEESRRIFIDGIVNNNIVAVNDLIAAHFYSDEKIVDINKRSVKYFIDHIGESELDYTPNADEEIKLKKFYYEQHAKIEYDLVNYISPALAPNNLLRINPYEDFQYRGHYLPSGFTFAQMALMEFYNSEIEYIRSPSDSRIDTLQSLISKYITNKMIEITPNGLVVRRSDIDFRSSGNAVNITSPNRSIPLDNLSAGEKKLILIFLIAVFFNDIDLLIDEPELSLSILWQEKLLPDIIQQTDIRRVIVATHSPFIGRDISLRDGIVPLPTEG